MGQRLIEGVPAPNVIEGLDAQGHDGEPMPKEAGFVRLDITPLGVGASYRRVYREPAWRRPIGALMKRRQGQGNSSPEVPSPWRAAARSMPPLARIRAT
jgi:hypothetical protein